VGPDEGGNDERERSRARAAAVGLSLLGALMNAASRSPWERFLWAPVSLVLAILVFVVARSDAVPDSS
jgi:hypothetical protein